MLLSLLSQSPFYSQPVANVFSIEVIKVMSFPCSEPFNYFLFSKNLAKILKILAVTQEALQGVASVYLSTLTLC